jgi:hypothetical protein
MALRQHKDSQSQSPTLPSIKAILNQEISSIHIPAEKPRYKNPLVSQERLISLPNTVSNQDSSVRLCIASPSLNPMSLSMIVGSD